MGTANVPDSARRQGRDGTVYQGGEKLGEVTGIEWSAEIEQIPVAMPGSYQDGVLHGAVGYRGSFRYQDLHDKWALLVLDYLDARVRGDRSVPAPIVDMFTKLSAMGAPFDTRYGLYGCQLFETGGGFSQADDLLEREVPIQIRRVKLLTGFVYGPGGVPQVVTRQ